MARHELSLEADGKSKRVPRRARRERGPPDQLLQGRFLRCPRCTAAPERACKAPTPHERADRAWGAWALPFLLARAWRGSLESNASRIHQSWRGAQPVCFEAQMEVLHVIGLLMVLSARFMVLAGRSPRVFRSKIGKYRSGNRSGHNGQAAFGGQCMRPIEQNVVLGRQQAAVWVARNR